MKQAINDQIELNILANKLNNNYNPRNTVKIEEKKKNFRICKKIAKCKKRYY